MFLGLLTLLTALSISAVAIYYSVAGLMTIFAAAAIPIMIMGGTLEVAKLVTAVWLHRYWRQATWWIKTYLTTAVVVLMFITSMGIFGFLSKAHIEQTSASQESVAQVERITTELARQEGIIARAQQKIQQLESSGTGADANIQNQINLEQERIDRAFERIQPAIAQQNQIIEDARSADADRTQPFETQLSNIQAELVRLENSAREYENSISGLEVDNSAVEPLLAQIAALEAEIIRVTNQLNSREQQQIRAAQAIIGVTSDGLFGSNTRTALATWVEGQRSRIAQIQGEVAQVRRDANSEVSAERERLAGVVADIRERQIPALKQRELDMLNRIDEIRQTESPVIQTARDEIQRLRASAESQVAQSQALIERLRQQLAQTDKAEEIDAQVAEQENRVREANAAIDTLTEQKYALEAEYRKLEAEVGPVKYIAEFVYGEQADTNLLEEAVRWVILIIIFVFDPLAVLLLIASQYTFELNRKRKDDQKELLRLKEWEEYERTRAQRIIDNPGYNPSDSTPSQEEKVNDITSRLDDGRNDRASETTGTAAEDGNRDSTEIRTTSDDSGEDARLHGLSGAGDNGRDAASGMDKGGIDDTTSKKTNADAHDANGELDTENSVSDDVSAGIGMEQVEVQSNGLTADEAARAYSGIDSKKKEIESLDASDEDEVIEERKAQWNAKEADVSLVDAKTKWKEDHPNETIKFYKLLYLKGKIDELPWERPPYKPDLTTTTNSEGYIQNSEQNENTLFNRLRRDPKD
jgi:uncharacterized protein YdcH (DUF465 family)